MPDPAVENVEALYLSEWRKWDLLSWDDEYPVSRENVTCHGNERVRLNVRGGFPFRLILKPNR